TCSVTWPSAHAALDWPSGWSPASSAESPSTTRSKSSHASTTSPASGIIAGSIGPNRIAFDPMATDLKLGLTLGYWGAQPPPGWVDLALEAERLGFDSVWTAEAYGSDVFTPLAWIGAQTSRIKLGTGITQLSARTPASVAMTAATLDHLSGGRVVLGLGVSGPQVV